MLKIGFAGKYYTLWESTTETETLPGGIRTVRTTNRYIKNISFDREKAAQRHPDAEFDESLSGKRGSFSYTRKIYPNDIFKYGKYRGECFEDCTDYDYMKWYFGTTDDEQREEIRIVLENNGYHFEYWGDNIGDCEIYSANEWNEKINHKQLAKDRADKMIDDFNNGNLVVLITHNPDSNGEYLDTNSEMTIKFDQVKENYYAGFPYYMPVLNGHCKRVKNKNIHITDGEVDGNIIKVHNFKVVR